MRRIAISLLVIGGVLASASQPAVAADQKTGRKATHALPAILETLDGKKTDLSEVVAGKPALLIFWATWCPNCREQTPRFKLAFDRYASKGLEVVAIDIGVRDSVEAVKRYVAELSIPYKVLYDVRHEAVRAYSVGTTPTVLLLDRAGNVVDWTHAVDFEAIEAVLDGKPVQRKSPTYEEEPRGSSSRQGSGS